MYLAYGSVALTLQVPSFDVKFSISTTYDYDQKVIEDVLVNEEVPMVLEPTQVGQVEVKFEIAGIKAKNPKEAEELVVAQLEKVGFWDVYVDVNDGEYNLGGGEDDSNAVVGVKVLDISIDEETDY